MNTNPTNTTKKPKTAKQMEAFKRANDAKNERLRKWREENARRAERGEEPLVWATKAKARKDALKAKEKEDKLHSLFLKSLEIQQKQVEDDEEKARIEKLKIKVKPQERNATRKRKPVRCPISDSESESDSESDTEDDYEEQPNTLQRSEPIKLVNQDKVANVDDVRAEFLRGEQEAQYIKALLQQQKQQPAPAPEPQPQSSIRPPAPAPAPRPQLPPRREAVRTEPMDKSEIAKRPQYATREDFDNMKAEVINKIQEYQQPQITVGNEKYSLITDTKQPKKPIEPPRYTTDINYVYNQQTLQKPIDKPLNIVRSSINPEPPAPAPAPNHNPNLSEERIRSMMGIRQRYEPVQQPIQYTTNSALLNRMFFNHN